MKKLLSAALEWILVTGFLCAFLGDLMTELEELIEVGPEWSAPLVKIAGILTFLAGAIILAGRNSRAAISTAAPLMSIGLIIVIASFDKHPTMLGVIVVVGSAGGLARMILRTHSQEAKAKADAPAKEPV